MLSADRMSAVKVVLVVVVLVVVAVAALVYAATSMPGRSQRGALVSATSAETKLESELRHHVEALCAQGPRNVDVPLALSAAAVYIQRAFESAGYRVEKQDYTVDGVVCENLTAEIRGTTKPDEIVIIGAHYDSIADAPGADDNASGVAGLLALAKRMHNAKPERTLRFVAFANEEPPHFKTGNMGSYRYAQRARGRNENIVAMLSLECIGYYRDEPGSQQYPQPLSRLYPDTANFVAFAGNLSSRTLVRRCVKTFREHASIPSEGAAMPEEITGIGWSDQWSFWRQGWKAVMVTDTAFFRNPNYHTVADLPETLNYERMARLVAGLQPVIEDLVTR
jgi:hypothetical protein